MNTENNNAVKGFTFAVEPIVSISTNERVGVEVLAVKSAHWTHTRWRTWYSLLPDIVKMTREFEHLDDSRYVAINIDSDQITDRHIYASLYHHLASTVLEWTERVPKHWRQADSMIVRAAGALERLREERNLRISFDDFGSGIDGFQRLGLIAPDYMKIDGRVLHGARNSGRQMYLLRHMVSLAHDMGITTVVEWVENAPDRHLVAASGADYAQGYLFGRREYNENGLVAEKPPQDDAYVAHKATTAY